MGVNTQTLEKRISDAGLKYAFVAKCLDISPQAFFKKRKGAIPFRRLEMLELQRILNISDKDMAEIFLP